MSDFYANYPSNVSGGGGTIGIGSPILLSAPNELLYTDILGNLAQDAGATRNPQLGFETTFDNLMKAVACNDTGAVVFQADNYGAVGNSISLVFDGIDDCTTVVNAWNAANPSNTVTLIGSGAFVPNAQTVQLSGGGTSRLFAGERTFFIYPVGGVEISATDTTSNWDGIHRAGSLEFFNPGNNDFGYYSLASGNGYFSGTIGSINGLVTSIISDTMTFQTSMSVSPNGAALAYNGDSMGVSNTGTSYWFANGIEYLFPNTGLLPNLSDALVVTNIVGNTVSLDFVANGGIPNGAAQYLWWRYNDDTGLQGWQSLYAATEDNIAKNVAFGYQAGGLDEANAPFGFSYSNTYIGYQAGYLNDPNLSTPGLTSQNVIIGSTASPVLTQGNDNVIVGYNGGAVIDTGSRNTFIGSTTAGATNAVSDSIVLGAYATALNSNSVAIGGIDINGNVLGAVFDIVINNRETDVSGRQYTIAYPSVRTGNTNGNGANVIFDCGGGTGTGKPSTFSFNVSEKNALPGTTPQGIFETFKIDGARDVSFGDLTGSFNNTKVLLDDVNETVTVNATNYLSVTTGVYRGPALHNNALAYGNASQGEVRSGTYSPTATAVLNVTSVSASDFQFMRVGNVVTVSGIADIDPAGNGTTTIRLSLPIATTMTKISDCVGVGASIGASGHVGGIMAYLTNNTAEFSFRETGGGTLEQYSIHFTYTVI